MKRVGHTAHTRDKRGTNWKKVGGQRPLGIPRSTGEDNIKMDFQAHTDYSHDCRTTKWKN